MIILIYIIPNDHDTDLEIDTLSYQARSAMDYFIPSIT